MINSSAIRDDLQNDSFIRRPGDEPLPGYRLIEPLGKGGFGEVWKCEAPGGLLKAVKFINGSLHALEQDAAQAVQELEAIEHIKCIRHPFVLSTERIEVKDGKVFIVMELADKNLEEVFVECQAAGLAGIPREKLLGYLLEVAEVLDLLAQQHGLQHLDIKPRNVLLVSNHVKVADFGLVKPIARGDGNAPPRPFVELSPQYASPEAFHGNYSLHSDQYSLAILYQKMLTGLLPFEGRNTRQIMMLHLTGKPDLDPLPVEDRPVVARALSKDPEQRYPSCRAFVQEMAYGAAHAEKPRAPKTLVPPGTPRPLRLASLRTFRRDPTTKQDPVNVPEQDNGLPITAIVIKREDLGITANPLRLGNIVLAPLPTFKFLDCLSQSPMGEFWKGQESDGRARLVYFAPLGACSDEPALERRVRKLRECRHLMVPPVQFYQNAVGQLVLVTEYYSRTLQDRFQECTAQHLPGIPRFELIRYLAAAAEALDDLYWRTEITHLGLSPRTLAFQQERIVMDQFGYVELACLLAGQPAVSHIGRYAAPELAHGSGSSASDQYSLALIYAEMLVGIHPRPEQLRSRRGRGAWGKLNLDFIPAPDREILACALDNDPEKRFASCSDFVQALKRTTVVTRDAARLPRHLYPVIPFASLLGEPLAPSVDLPSVHELVTQQHCAELGAAQPISYGRFHCTVAPNGALEHKFAVRSLSSIATLKLDGFRQHGKLQLAEESEYALLYRLYAHQSLWEKWLGKPQGLEIRLSMPPTSQPEFTDVTIRLEAFGGDLGTQMLRETGAELIRNLRRFLQAGPERRERPRWDFGQPLRVYPVFPDLELAEPIAGKGKDLSLEGISLSLPQRPSASYFYVHLNTSEPMARWVLLAKVMRVREREDGWFEIGAVFPQAADAIARPALLRKA